jgi:hypothetical protein
MLLKYSAATERKMLKVEYYKSRDEALARLNKLLDETVNMITRVNTTMERIKAGEAKTISQGILNLKSYSVLDQKGREIYRLVYLGLIGDIDEESLNQLKQYYMSLRKILNSLINSLSRMSISEPLAIVYLDEAPIMLIHNIDEKSQLGSLISELANLTSAG